MTWLWLLMTCCAAPLVGQPVEVIDLRAHKHQGAPEDGPTAPVSSHVVSGGPARRDAPPIQLPLEIALLGLDRNSYQYLDAFTYQVTITNTGTVALLLPRGRAGLASLSQPADHPRAEDLRCSLRLMVQAGGVGYVAASVSLGAASNHADEVLSLGSGQSVEFIGEGRWDFSPPEIGNVIRRRLPATFAATAEFSMNGSPQFAAWGAAVSRDAVPIALRPHPEAELRKIGPRPSTGDITYVGDFSSLQEIDGHVTGYILQLWKDGPTLVALWSKADGQPADFPTVSADEVTWDQGTGDFRFSVRFCAAVSRFQGKLTDGEVSGDLVTLDGTARAVVPLKLHRNGVQAEWPVQTRESWKSTLDRMLLRLQPRCP